MLIIERDIKITVEWKVRRAVKMLDLLGCDTNGYVDH